MKKILLLILILPLITACQSNTPQKTNETSSQNIEVEKMSNEKMDKLDDDSDGDNISDTETTEESAERRRVEVLKSNKQGDPDANRYDFGNDTTNNNCGEGATLDNGTCVAESNENVMDNDCDSTTDEECKILDDDDDGDSVPTGENNNSNIIN